MHNTPIVPHTMRDSGGRGIGGGCEGAGMKGGGGEGRGYEGGVCEGRGYEGEWGV